MAAKTEPEYNHKDDEGYGCWKIMLIYKDGYKDVSIKEIIHQVNVYKHLGIKMKRGGNE